MAEGVSVDRSAALFELDASEVRRLLKASSTDAERRGGDGREDSRGADDGAVTPLPHRAGTAIPRAGLAEATPDLVRAAVINEATVIRYHAKNQAADIVHACRARLGV